MKDINATIVLDLKGKSEEEIFRGIKYTRRKYIKQAIKKGLYFEQDYSEVSLKKMYEIHSKIMLEGGIPQWTFKKWRAFVSIAGEKFFLIKLKNKIVGCFILSEIDERYYNLKSKKKGIRPLVFANLKEYNSYRPNDFIYWLSIQYSLQKGYDFFDLGGWQINARDHLKNINNFKEDWGGKIIYYKWDYPFFTAIRRKLIRNFSFFWKINSFVKSKLGKRNKSVHDDYAVARSLTSISSM